LGKKWSFVSIDAPYAVDMVVFQEDQRKDGFYGTKTFFIKVQYDCGDVSRRLWSKYLPGWIVAK
jgi:hypothetical protein